MAEVADCFIKILEFVHIFRPKQHPNSILYGEDKDHLNLILWIMHLATLQSEWYHHGNFGCNYFFPFQNSYNIIQSKPAKIQSTIYSDGYKIPCTVMQFSTNNVQYCLLYMSVTLSDIGIPLEIFYKSMEASRHAADSLWILFPFLITTCYNWQQSRWTYNTLLD